MPLELYSQVPEFEGKTQDGSSFESCITLRDGSWTVLFSYPSDFTPICSTEISAFAQLQQEFEKRNCNLVALSTDSVQSHADWIKDVEAMTKNTVKVTFPIVADEDGKILDSLKMRVHAPPPKSEQDQQQAKRSKNNLITTRTTYIIDPNGIICYVAVNPTNAGRNIEDLIRVLDGIQLANMKETLGTPANWRVGQDVVLLPNAEHGNGTRPVVTKRYFPYLEFTSSTVVGV